MLRLTSQELADLTGVSRDMIKRAERDTAVPHLQTAGLSKIKRTLEMAGVVFLPDQGENVCGIALRKEWKASQSD